MQQRQQPWPAPVHAHDIPVEYIPIWESMSSQSTQASSCCKGEYTGADGFQHFAAMDSMLLDAFAMKYVLLPHAVLLHGLGMAMWHMVFLHIFGVHAFESESRHISYP